MKNYNVKFLLVMICFLINYKAYSRERLQIVIADLEGTWISDDDNSWKMIFTADKCYWYSNNELTGEYNYSVSTTSPQCGVAVLTGDDYLQLINSQNTNDKMCYVINDAGAKTLSLSPVDKGGVLVFTKQAVYARIEIGNMYEEETADTYEEYGDVYIRFYRDANCTTPYYLDNDIDNMIVKESYGVPSNSWGDEIQYLVPGGQNEVSLGEKLLYSSYVSYDSSTEEYQFMSFVSRFTIYPLPKFTIIQNYFYF